MPDHPSNRPTQESLSTLFTYHQPTEEQISKYRRIRLQAEVFASEILACCPPCADTSAAIRKIREAVMTANAAIACAPSSD